jgi:hypothetical protein
MEEALTHFADPKKKREGRILNGENNFYSFAFRSPT